MSGGRLRSTPYTMTTAEVRSLFGPACNASAILRIFGPEAVAARGHWHALIIVQHPAIYGPMTFEQRAAFIDSRMHFVAQEADQRPIATTQSAPPPD